MKTLLEIAQLGFKPIIDEILAILNSMPHHIKSQIYDMDRFNSESFMSQKLYRTPLRSTDINFHMNDFCNEILLTNLNPKLNDIDLKSIEISVENNSSGLCMVVKSLEIIKLEKDIKIIYKFNEYESKIEIFHYVKDKEKFLSGGYLSLRGESHAIKKLPEFKIEKNMNGFEQILTLFKLGFGNQLKEMLFLGKKIDKEDLDILSITHDLDVDIDFLNLLSIDLPNISNANILKNNHLKNLTN